MDNQERGEHTIEVNGEEKEFFLSLADFKRIEDHFDVSSIMEMGNKLQEISFSDLLYILELGIRDESLTEEEIGNGITKAGKAMEIVVSEIQSAMDIDLEEENIPDDVQEQIEEKKEQIEQNPTQ